MSELLKSIYSGDREQLTILRDLYNITLSKKSHIESEIVLASRNRQNNKQEALECELVNVNVKLKEIDDKRTSLIVRKRKQTSFLKFDEILFRDTLHEFLEDNDNTKFLSRSKRKQLMYFKDRLRLVIPSKEEDMWTYEYNRTFLFIKHQEVIIKIDDIQYTLVSDLSINQTKLFHLLHHHSNQANG